MTINKIFYTVLNYSLKTEAFTNQSEIFKTSGMSSQWELVHEDVYRLVHLIDYTAIIEGSNEQFIRYDGKLELLCRFTDLEHDAVEIIRLKDQARLSMEEFLMKNTETFFEYLNFTTSIFSIYENAVDDLDTWKAHLINEELKSIKRVMNILSTEEMSKQERKLRNKD